MLVFHPWLIPSKYFFQEVDFGSPTMPCEEFLTFATSHIGLTLETAEYCQKPLDIYVNIRKTID